MHNSMNVRLNVLILKQDPACKQHIPFPFKYTILSALFLFTVRRNKSWKFPVRLAGGSFCATLSTDGKIITTHVKTSICSLRVLAWVFVAVKRGMKRGADIKLFVINPVYFLTFLLIYSRNITVALVNWVHTMFYV